jgi:hypothetical protein
MAMVSRGDGQVNDRPARPNKECPYWRKVRRRFTFLNKVRRVLGDLQDIVDDMDPGFDPTVYYTDPDESRLCVVDELLRDAGLLLRDGRSEEAEDKLRGEWGAYQAVREAFTNVLDAGLAFCDADEESKR